MSHTVGTAGLDATRAGGAWATDQNIQPLASSPIDGCKGCERSLVQQSTVHV